MSVKNKVRIGIIGAGSFANVHMEHFRKLDDSVEVVAFSRRDLRALDETRKRWDVPFGFTDYRDMLVRSDIDAVDIITPTSSHKPIAMDAIAAGKHVLCDKPLALTAKDAREMWQAADQRGIIHSTNFNQRGNSAVGRLKRYIDKGYVGDRRHALIWWGMSMAEKDKPHVLSWRFREEHGGGVVHEIIHVLDMVRFIGGEVERVVAKLDTHMRRRSFIDAPEGLDITTPDSAACILEWKNGGYASILISFASKGTDPDGNTCARVELSGDDGRLETVGRYGVRGMTGLNTVMQDLDPGAPYPQPYQRFTEAVASNNQTKVETSFYDGFKAAELVDAIYKSAYSGHWVEVGRQT